MKHTKPSHLEKVIKVVSSFRTIRKSLIYSRFYDLIDI